MKKITSLLAAGATLIVLALPALATRVYSTGEEPQDPCSQESKTALYGEFYANFRGGQNQDQAKAYEAAKKYIACPADSSDQTEAKRIDYLKDFITRYEKANRKTKLTELMYTKKDYPAAFEVGRQVLADDPGYVKAYIDLGYAGYLAGLAGNLTLSNDSINYAKRAIEMVEAGKVPDQWAPFTGKDDTLAGLNFAIASLTQKSSPADSIPYFIKALSYNSELKKWEQAYAFLTAAYEVELNRLLADYETKYKGKDETPESKLALANINQIMDRVVDSLARAVALAANNPKSEQSRTQWLGRLTELYKFRHNNSDTGLNEMIASILSKPLPPVPTPITTLPAASPATNPSATVNTTGTNQATSDPLSTGKPAVPASTSPSSKAQPSKTVAPAGSKSTTPKPSTASSPRPKTKRNHNRH